MQTTKVYKNVRTHTHLETREAIIKLGWTVLHQPPYSSDLARSDFHLFGPVKDVLCGTWFEDEGVIHEAKKWLMIKTKSGEG